MKIFLTKKRHFLNSDSHWVDLLDVGKTRNEIGPSQKFAVPLFVYCHGNCNMDFYKSWLV